MLKSCAYCGKIHDTKFMCDKKPQRQYKVTDIDKFRWTKSWQHKREDINKRDKYMCQICIRKLYDTQLQYNYTDIEVHHIVPIAEDYNTRLDNDNLLCMCACHHKMAERGEIPRAQLQDIVHQQESDYNTL